MFKNVLINKTKVRSTRPKMSDQQKQTNSTAFFSRSRQNKIRPLSAGTVENVQVEIRPNRFLRIQHINARPRDAKFEKEMQMQAEYKKQGLTTSVGPLTMPPKKPAREKLTIETTQNSTVLPNSVDQKSSNNNTFREISASGAKAQFTSPSNVHVAMENLVVGGVDSNPSANSSGSKALREENQISEHNRTSDAAGEHEQKKPSDSEPNNTVPDANKTTPRSEPHARTPSVTVQSKPQTTPRHHPDNKSDLPSSSTPGSTLSPKTPSTVLFFFHGVGGSSDVWRTQIKHLAKEGYEIVAPDLIGHGMSCTPKNARAYHFQETAADMEEIFDKYCKRRNIVIGHSYGCSFAVVIARRRSRRVQKLVLISGGAPTPLAPQPGIFSLPNCMLRCVRPCLNHGFHRSAFHKSRRPMVDKEEAFSIPTYVLQHTMNGQRWADGDEVYHQWLLCSTLLIYGAQDKLVTLEEEKHMEETIFRSRLEVIPDASHMVMIEAPDEVNRLLLNFFQEDPSITPKNTSPLPTPTPTPATSRRPPLDRSVSRVSIKSTKSHRAMPTHVI